MDNKGKDICFDCGKESTILANYSYFRGCFCNEKCQDNFHNKLQLGNSGGGSGGHGSSGGRSSSGGRVGAGGGRAPNRGRSGARRIKRRNQSSQGRTRSNRNTRSIRTNSNRNTSRSSSRSPNRSTNRSSNRNSSRSPNRSTNRSSSRNLSRSPNRSSNRSNSRNSNRSPNRASNRSHSYRGGSSGRGSRGGRGFRGYGFGRGFWGIGFGYGYGFFGLYPWAVPFFLPYYSIWYPSLWTPLYIEDPDNPGNRINNPELSDDTNINNLPSLPTFSTLGIDQDLDKVLNATENQRQNAIKNLDLVISAQLRMLKSENQEFIDQGYTIVPDLDSRSFEWVKVNNNNDSSIQSKSIQNNINDIKSNEKNIDATYIIYDDYDDDFNDDYYDEDDMDSLFLYDDEAVLEDDDGDIDDDDIDEDYYDDYFYQCYNCGKPTKNEYNYEFFTSYFCNEECQHYFEKQPYLSRDESK